VSTGETSRASQSARISKSEAEMGRSVAILQTKFDELRRDVERLEGMTVEQAAQVHATAGKASAALTKAKQALDASRRQDTAPIVVGTGPQGTVPWVRNQAAVVGTATIGGASLYAIVEFIIERLTQ